MTLSPRQMPPERLEEIERGGWTDDHRLSYGMPGSPARRAADIIRDLLADRAHLLKPVREGEVAACIDLLQRNAFTLDRDAALDVLEMVSNMQFAADLIAKLTAQLFSTQGKLEEARKALAECESLHDLERRRAHIKAALAQ
jgi:hypothetical protein